MSNEADPSGDLVLKVGYGESEKSIRVQSKVMSLASPVFAAMLSSRYAEGQKAGHNHWTVTLPDDDPEAMFLICTVLHFQQHDSVDHPYQILGKVACLCEKYDLMGPLRAWAEMALRSKALSSETKIEFTHLLDLSCMFGSQEGVWLSSLKLITANWPVGLSGMSSTEPMPQEDMFDMSGTIIPTHLHVAVDITRIHIMQSIRDELEHIITRFIDRDTRESIMTVGHYFRELRRLGLWPLPDTSSDADIKQVMTKLKSARDCTCQSCVCSELGLSKHLTSFAETLESNVRGVCLNCVKEGRLSPIQKNCMAFIAADCSSPKAPLSVPHFFPLGKGSALAPGGRV